MPHPLTKNIFQGARRQAGEAGFTFIELIVVMGIFAIMASVVLFNFRTFGTKVDLNNLAQDMGLRIVQAQKEAISGEIDAANDITDETYGVYFSDSTTAPDNTQFVYFTDLASNGAKNGLFDAGNYDSISCPATPTAGNECLSITSITTGDYVSDICYDLSNSPTPTCLPAGGQAHISFTRPFPDAMIYVRASAAGPKILAKDVHIEVTSGTDPTVKKTIGVTNLGKIWVYDGGADVSSN